MSRIPGLWVFQPVPLVPGISLLPEPWQSATTEQKLLYAQTTAAFGNYDQLQQTYNMIAIEKGNLRATHAIGDYNGAVKRYWLNGGPNGNYALPATLPDLAQYYRPAEDATDVYDSSTRTWHPNGTVIETPIWTLPPDTVLYIVEP